MVSELIKAFLLIFVAEMGDKTQILAMTFVTRYKVSQVLTGVFLGSLLNHSIAIILGTLLSSIIPVNTIQLIAGISFIVFGFLSLRIEDEENEGKSIANKFGPVLTVGLAFFIGELGDKTQLTAMTIATDSSYPIFVLLGTVLGMIVTSGIGIFIGSKIGEKIPEISIKIGSAIVFILFGTQKIYSNIRYEYINSLSVILFIITILMPFSLMLRKNLILHKQKKLTPFKEAAKTLYDYTHKLNELVSEICLTETECGKCSGKECLIGYTKNILSNANLKEEYILTNDHELPNKFDKNFDKDKIINTLAQIIIGIEENKIENKNHVIIKTKDSLELLLINETIEYLNKENYISKLKEIDSNIYRKLKIYIENLEKEND